jgi:tetratricopeptide (TPR) repeat protein
MNLPPILSTATPRFSLLAVIATAALSACAVPQPYKPSLPPEQVPPSQPQAPVESRPADQPPPIEQAPPPPPVIREPVLSPASRALVGQAQAQLASKNFAVAASSIERALRIDPDNPLLWIELGKVRQAEGNFVQAENMGRKAVSMATNAPRAQSAAWTLIAQSYQARGRNSEAREAQLKAATLSER